MALQWGSICTLVESELSSYMVIEVLIGCILDQSVYVTTVTGQRRRSFDLLIFIRMGAPATEVHILLQMSAVPTSVSELRHHHIQFVGSGKMQALEYLVHLANFERLLLSIRLIMI